MNLDKLLDRCATGLVILACLGVLYRIGPQIKSGRQIPTSASSAPSETDFLGLSLREIRPTPDGGGVLAFLSSTCPYCEKSIPYYRSLAGSLKTSGRNLLVALVDKRETAAEYIADRRLSEAVPVQNPRLAGFKIRGTPTLLSYDAQGRVTGIWTGWLNHEREEQVQSRLAADQKRPTGKKGLR